MFAFYFFFNTKKNCSLKSGTKCIPSEAHTYTLHVRACSRAPLSYTSASHCKTGEAASGGFVLWLSSVLQSLKKKTSRRPRTSDWLDGGIAFVVVSWPGVAIAILHGRVGKVTHFHTCRERYDFAHPIAFPGFENEVWPFSACKPHISYLGVFVPNRCIVGWRPKSPFALAGFAEGVPTCLLPIVHPVIQQVKVLKVIDVEEWILAAWCACACACVGVIKYKGREGKV